MPTPTETICEERRVLAQLAGDAEDASLLLVEVSEGRGALAVFELRAPGFEAWISVESRAELAAFLRDALREVELRDALREIESR